MENNPFQYFESLQSQLKQELGEGLQQPDYWVVVDTRYVPASRDDSEIEYIINMEDYHVMTYHDYLNDVIELSNDILQNDEDDGTELTESIVQKLQDIVTNPSHTQDRDIERWMLKYEPRDSIRIEFLKKEDYIVPDTCFMLQSEAINHMRFNEHQYSEDAYIKCMRAWQSHTMFNLINTIKNTDWSQYSLIPKYNHAKEREDNDRGS